MGASLKIELEILGGNVAAFVELLFPSNEWEFTLFEWDAWTREWELWSRTFGDWSGTLDLPALP